MIRAISFCMLIALMPFAPAALAEQWHYEDGAGVAVTLSEPPQRIIAHATVAAALIAYGIRPIGILLDGPPSRDRSLDGLDLSDVPVVSRGWFAVDAEAILNLDPDIIITEYALNEQVYQGGTHEDGMFDRLSSIAPIIGIPRTNSILETLDTYRDFAESLGVDVEAAELQMDRARLDESITALQNAIADKPDLTVLAVSPYSSGLSIGVPELFGELNDWQNWGLNLISPEATPGTSYLTVSWENAEAYPADILLLDDRWETSSLTTMQDHPIGKRLPAIAGGQTGEWPAEWIRSYAQYADEIEKLTALIARSDQHLVD